MKTKKKADKGFRTVEFMRHVREELTEQFSKDKQKYLAFLGRSMEDFKLRQKKTHS